MVLAAPQAQASQGAIPTPQTTDPHNHLCPVYKPPLRKPPPEIRHLSQLASGTPEDYRSALVAYIEALREYIDEESLEDDKAISRYILNCDKQMRNTQSP